jgi:hypothetical protein
MRNPTPLDAGHPAPVDSYPAYILTAEQRATLAAGDTIDTGRHELDMFARELGDVAEWLGRTLEWICSPEHGGDFRQARVCWLYAQVAAVRVDDYAERLKLGEDINRIGW